MIKIKYLFIIKIYISHYNKHGICASNVFVIGQPSIFVESATDTLEQQQRGNERESISHPNEWDKLLAGVFVRAVEVKQEGVVSTGLTGRVMLSCQ